jgi:hypothetical protein
MNPPNPKLTKKGLGGFSFLDQVTAAPEMGNIFPFPAEIIAEISISS